MSEAEFRQEVEQAIKLYEGLIGHAATRTRPMIDKYGEIVVIKGHHTYFLTPN